MKDELRWVWLSLAHFKTFLSCFLETLRKDWNMSSEPRFGPASWRTRNKIVGLAKWLVELQVIIRLERNLLEINVGVLESNSAYCDHITWHVWWVLSFIGVTATVMQTATHQHFRGVLLGCSMQRLAGVAYHTYFIAVHCAVLSRCNPITAIADIPHYTFLVNTGSLI